MMKSWVGAIALLVAVTGSLSAQHEHSPYAGMHTAEGTTLTPEEIGQLRAGEGMRLALAAELNHYPGPRHVLDMRHDLALTAGQVERIEVIYTQMREAAIRVGESLITVEGHLATIFRDSTANVDQIRQVTSHLGSLRGELQAIHLSAHVATRAELTPAQVTRYDELRGYLMSGGGGS